MSKRLVDADKLIDLCDQMSRDDWNKKVAPVSWADAYEGFIEDIDEQPTVDAVEVIRCKDCAHCNYDPSAEIYKCERRYIPERVSEVDYCSHGEKRCEG